MLQYHNLLISPPLQHWREQWLKTLSTDHARAKRALGWTALSVHVMTAATYNVFAKELTPALSPLSILFLSELLTGLFSHFSFGLIPVLRQFINLPRRIVLPLLIVGTCNGVIAPLLIFSGLEQTSAVNASLFANAEMLFLILLGVFVLHEKWTVRHGIATCVMTAGLAIIALKGFTEGIRPQFGDLLILCGGLTFSIGSTVFRRFLHHLDPSIAIFVRTSLAMAAFFLVSPFLERPLISEIHAFSASLILPLLGFGFVARFLNVFSFYGAIERLPMSTVSLVSSLNVILATFFAFIYLHEPILPYHFFGGALIIFGTILLEVIGTHPSEEHLEAHMTVEKHHRV